MDKNKVWNNKHLNGIILMLLIPLTLCFASICFAGDWWEDDSNTPIDIVHVDKNKHGRVESASRTNWRDGYIEVMAGATADTRHTISQAHAYSVALKTARHLAYEKLAETVRGLHLSSNAIYDRELLLDSNLKTKVTALIRNARVIKEENHEFGDGSLWVEVTLGLRLYGKKNTVILAILSKQKNSVPVRSQVVAAQNPNSKKQPAKDHIVDVGIAGSKTEKQDNKTIPKVEETEAVTGLIVDARGLNGQPAMLSRLISEDGSFLYSSQEVSSSYIREIGLMGYQNTMEGAKKLKRTGSNPLVVNALATAGRYHADFVLSQEDTARIRRLAEKSNFLKQCRVVIVLDK